MLPIVKLAGIFDWAIRGGSGVTREFESTRSPVDTDE
jgi:hypothetical protein